MQKLNVAEMAQVEGGSDYVWCGIGAGLTAVSIFYAPFAAPSALEFTAIACMSGQ